MREFFYPRYQDIRRYIATTPEAGGHARLQRERRAVTA
jgi:hypothetical protein